MASIINSISFHNFFNYYGSFEDNIYELKEGINIIVADNGAGKSKFFNAFLWLFNDQILDSDDKKTKNVKDVCFKILSDKIKNEIGVGDHVSCGIQIEYTSGTRYKYQITKSFGATKLNDNITSKDGWSFIMNDVEVNRSELVLHRYKPIYDDDQKREIIDKLIMPAFRRYSFLQGEEVDQIIDFGQKSSIEEAVRDLTDIKKYEELVVLTTEFKDKAFKDLNNQNKANDAQSKRLEEAIREKERAESQLEKELQKLEEFERTYREAEEEKTELDKHYSNAEKRKELDDKIKPLNRKLKEKAEEFEVFLDRINNRFFDGNFSWIAMGFDSVLDDFRKLNDKFIDKRYEKKALLDIQDNPNNYFHFLPVNSPDAVSLSNMIDNEYCYVCDRPAKIGTREHDYLIKLKNRPSDSTKNKSFVKNDLKNFFGDIQINAQPFYNKMDSIPSTISKTREKEKEYEESINKLKEKLKSLKDQRRDILVAGTDSDSNDREILNSYAGAIKRMESSRSRIDDIIAPKISKLETEVKKIEDEIKSLADTQDIPQGYKDNYSIAKDIAEATLNAKNRIYDDMIKLLEKHANNHFRDLIVNNDLSGGILKFEKTPSNSINFNYQDSKGNVVYGSSEGFQRMKKFSVVMAIISANTTQYNYPLLADAPISAFGEGFTEGFFEATGKVFPQSIVLVKELYNRKDEQKLTDLGKKLLKDNIVKTMYVNQVPEGAEQIDLVTTKIKLK